MRAPEIVVAISFTRNVGTPQASAAQVQVAVPKSRVVLYFGCGVAACFMAFVVLFILLIAFDESDGGDDKE